MAAEQTPPRRRRSIWVSVVLAMAILLALDLARPPRRQLSAQALLLSIDVYQATLSKALSQTAVRCRFTPTCSHYGEAAIAENGALKGSVLAAWRVLRCGPWTAAGTVDPAPLRPSRSTVENEVQ